MPAIPFKSKTRFAALLAGLLCLSPALSAWAQNAAPPTQPTTTEEARAELERIQESIRLSKERAAELRAEIEKMSGDRAEQNAALIAAAQRVKLTEIEVNAAEERLLRLRADEAAVRERLDGTDADIATLLAALERISKSPPPALIVNPTDALGSARGAILLAEIFPQLRARSDAVITDLEQLVGIREQAERETEEIKANFALLYEEQLRIATLIAARKRSLERTTAELQAQDREAEALAEQASSLSQLIDTLASRFQDVATAVDAANAQQPGRPGRLSAPEIRIALADTDRESPAFAFSKAKGYLSAPSAGTMVTDYGASDGFGGISNGLSILTRPEAQVVAPVDAWVMYKGPYLNYGQIVILNPGEGYSLLLAGLEEVDVELGQFVLLGEPIGKMGTHTTGRTLQTSAGVSRPTLYIELRDEDGPIDPTGWWDETQGVAFSDNDQTRSG